MSTFKEALDRKYTYDAGNCDVAVVGAGHAGCEAALATARSGLNTILFTMNLDAVANMPCNPNIGGTAKGQLVREIDALGGEMGKNADRTFIQSRMLNASKGPAVLSPRAQIDRRKYQMEMKQVIEKQDNLNLRQAEIIEILYRKATRSENINEKPNSKVKCSISENNNIYNKNIVSESIYTKDFETEKQVNRRIIEGVVSRNGGVYACTALVISTGTYMESRIIVGETAYSGGPDGMFPSMGLSKSLQEMGVSMQRFKTGTPVRVNKKEIHIENLEEQFGDETPCLFSYENEQNHEMLTRKQISCYLTWTTEDTRSAIMDNIHRSPLYSGEIEGTGPRYCPSIEDKFVKFPHRERHQVFIEPTGEFTNEMYIQGMSSSMPEEVQVKMLHSIPGLEDTHIMRTAYAIEYDCIIPTQLRLSLEHKDIDGLFCAGQINGSSGYEEAGAQGLLAGINASCKLKGKEPVIIDRSAAYLGVLVDDLVTKGTAEPYRMMTSRAEYRLLLRQDNADERLTQIGYDAGLIREERYVVFLTKMQQVKEEIARVKKTFIAPSELLNEILSSRNSTSVKNGVSIAELLRRPEINYQILQPIDSKRPTLPNAVQFEVEVQIKYEGYIELELDRINKFKKLENKKIPDQIKYTCISGLRIEAQQKLEKARPDSIGQASRVSGVSPADISVLLVYIESLKQNNRYEKENK